MCVWHFKVKELLSRSDCMYLMVKQSFDADDGVQMIGKDT